jgi:hypothetical protein
MIKIGFVHTILAYLSISTATIGLILAAACRVSGHAIGFQITSYMFVAGISALFAIYFFIGVYLFRNKEIKLPFAPKVVPGVRPEIHPNLSNLRAFSLVGDNKGLNCPFKPGICQDGFCEDCQVYLDWQKRGERLIACVLCGREISRESAEGESHVRLALCPECWEIYWSE